MALTPQPEHSTPARILLADDQEDILDALQLLLKRAGYQTTVVTHTSAVLEALEVNDFDLLLIDLNYAQDTTSGGEGLDLLSQIRLIDETVPVLVMTAWSTVDLAVEAMQRGASDFVQKPWQNMHLLEKIQAHVARYRDLASQQRRRLRQDTEPLKLSLEAATTVFRTRIPKEVPARKIGKYEIGDELGRGAMGVVFKARDPLIGRLVALKTLALAASQSEDLRQRFYREAQAAGGLQHPNIVTVYEMGEQNGVPFIVMEYLEGESLDAVLSRSTQIPLAQKLGYLVQVCRALSYAHQHGIVHRDIKPGNIVVTRDGTVKVVDFGIARIVDTSKTHTGVLVGTLAYLSPQLVKGEPADERSDIWATGVVCYELFAGLKPFDGDNHAALLRSIVSDEPRSLAKLAPDCPDEIRVIIERMLRKKTEDRYQSFEELLGEIEPLWRRQQRECVDEHLARAMSSRSEGFLEEVRAEAETRVASAPPIGVRSQMVEEIEQEISIQPSARTS